MYDFVAMCSPLAIELAMGYTTQNPFPHRVYTIDYTQLTNQHHASEATLAGLVDGYSILW